MSNELLISHQIYLIRHGDVHLAPDICYGQLDCLPDPKSFDNESQRLIDFFNARLNQDNHVKVISSPLKRCYLLAQELQEGFTFNVELSFEAAFKELNFGDWEGLSWSTINQQQVHNWSQNFLGYQLPNGESASEFYQRVLQAWQTILQALALAKTPQTLIIICHAGVIRGILSDFLKVPLSHSLSLKVDKMSASLLSYVPAQKKLSRCQFINLPIV